MTSQYLGSAGFHRQLNHVCVLQQSDIGQWVTIQHDVNMAVYKSEHF
jgi:hypothetical protein